MGTDEGENMELSKKERFIIANQLKILEKLYPDEADSYATDRKAVEYGFALHYPWVMEHIYDELTAKQCEEVLEILQMYSSLKFSYDTLNDKSEIDEESIRFPGFDGNNETMQMVYTRYFIVDLDRYSELRYGTKLADFNSHMPSLDNYRRMLTIWEDLPNQQNLSKESILKILKA
ncbi:YfbU family protein [Nitrospina gracilis]|nr:YfbU family protein [Nitrospina gracilis]